MAILNAGNPSTMLSALNMHGMFDLGVLGASMAQNAGCYDRQKRCYEFSGRKSTRRQVFRNGRVEKKTGPVSGFAVRLAEHLEKMWPVQVRIHNSGLDATPIQHVLDCFHSYIPHKVDAVIVDPGSMAKYSSTEDLRRVVHRLQALKTPPHIIFLLFHEWFGQRSRRFYELDEDNPWNRMERIALQICREIDATCISPRRELFSIVNKNHTKLLEFVGEDGLHIVNSEHGIDYVTELLIRWIDVYQSRKVDRVNPLFVHRVSAAASRCYRFGGRSPQRFRLLDWKTAPCPNCPSRNGSIPCNSDATLWRFCAWVQTKFKTKLSPSVRADIVNSTLMINLDTRLSQNPMITLQHLTSFYDAGKVNYACSSGCRCMPGRIDALNKSVQNSIFVPFYIHTTTASCVLTIALIRSPFRIRSIHVT